MDRHLFVKFPSGTAFSSCLCKSTTWFLRERVINSKWFNLGTYCVRYPQEMPFLNFFLVLSYSKNLKFGPCLRGFNLRIALNLWKNVLFGSYWRRDLPWGGGGGEIFQFFLFFHFQCLSRYVYGHNVTMKFPLDFHNYTGFLLLIYHCPIKYIDFSLQASLICKKEKKHHMKSGS